MFKKLIVIIAITLISVSTLFVSTLNASTVTPESKLRSGETYLKIGYQNSEWFKSGDEYATAYLKNVESFYTTDTAYDGYGHTKIVGYDNNKEYCSNQEFLTADGDYTMCAVNNNAITKHGGLYRKQLYDYGQYDNGNICVHVSSGYIASKIYGEN